MLLAAGGIFGYALTFLGITLGLVLVLRPSPRKDPEAKNKGKKKKK